MEPKHHKTKAYQVFGGTYLHSCVDFQMEWCGEFGWSAIFSHRSIDSEDHQQGGPSDGVYGTCSSTQHSLEKFWCITCNDLAWYAACHAYQVLPGRRLVSFTKEIAAVLTQKGETRNIATTWNNTEKLEMDLLTKSKAIREYFCVSSVNGYARRNSGHQKYLRCFDIKYNLLASLYCSSEIS